MVPGGEFTRVKWKRARGGQDSSYEGEEGMSCVRRLGDAGTSLS